MEEKEGRQYGQIAELAVLWDLSGDKEEERRDMGGSEKRRGVEGEGCEEDPGWIEVEPGLGGMGPVCAVEQVQRRSGGGWRDPRGASEGDERGRGGVWTW